ncbi:MAG: hypothetical protein ABJC26_09940 [Gemmatimonadaceae bacterium]
MHRFRATTLALLSMLSVLACHHAPTPVAPRLVGTAVGDISAYQVDFLSLDPVQGRLRYRLGAAAYVVLLEVTPGKSIHLIAPNTLQTPSKENAGSHLTDIQTMAALDEAAGAAQDEYEACYNNGIQAATPKPTIIPAKRDKDGKIIVPASVTTPTGPPGGVAQSIANRCQTIRNERLRTSSLRQSGERYLVLLASDVSMNSAQLLDRLSQMNVVASDVRSTIEAIALGLYINRPAVWSGYYTSL